jgi:NMD protein affecting ribosome stability and mRNA decay
MGFAVIENKVKLPRYSGTLVCQRCEAEYSDGEWVRGYYSGTGTTNLVFNEVAKIAQDCCPICSHKQPQQ